MNFVRLGLVSLGAFGLVASGSAAAANRYHAATIKTIYANDAGVVILSFDTESSYCTSTASPKYYAINPTLTGVTPEGVKQMYAAALMAYSLGMPVTILFDDATSSCNVKQIILGA